MANVFTDFDVAGFWEPSEYALKEYVGAPLIDETVAVVERELGYKLPASYVGFMRFQNGGISRRVLVHRELESAAVGVSESRGRLPVAGVAASCCESLALGANPGVLFGEGERDQAQ